MSVSSLLGSPVMVATRPAPTCSPRARSHVVVIECSSRPNKKATAHHMKTRPKKTQPWDIKRKPTVYAPLPKLPPDWTLVSDDNPADAPAPAPVSLEEPAASG